MKAKTGQVFVHYAEREGVYVACHVVAARDDSTQATITPLDWVGQDPPSPDALARAQPLVLERYAFEHSSALRNVPNRVPRGWTLWGELPAQLDKPCWTFSFWSADPMLGEHRWRAVPSEVRRRYKDAAASEETLTLEGVADDAGEPFPFPRCTREFWDERRYAVAPDFDITRLSALPALTELRLWRPHPGLVEWLAEAPLIRTAVLGAQGVPALDLRGTWLVELTIDATGLTRLQLPASLERLTLRGDVAPNLLVEARDAGRWVKLTQGRALPSFSGLDALGGVELRDVRTLDVGSMARRFPMLEHLRIWGAPAVLEEVSALGTLSRLTELTLSDTFGFAASDFPPPSALPLLDELWLTSIPADVAADVKKAYRKHGSLELSVTKPRKPEWLSENLDNPFRDWDGREGITAANAKKAASAYRALVSGVRSAVAQHGGDAGALELAATELVRAYIAAFNAADRRTGFIETVEREEIMDALFRGLGGLPESVPRAGLLDLGDGLRDF